LSKRGAPWLGRGSIIASKVAIRVFLCHKKEGFIFIKPYALLFVTVGRFQ
jgi:hypothetical protein